MYKSYYQLQRLASEVLDEKLYKRKAVTITRATHAIFLETGEKRLTSQRTKNFAGQLTVGQQSQQTTQRAYDTKGVTSGHDRCKDEQGR